jgi:hypothetical protein
MHSNPKITTPQQNHVAFPSIVFNPIIQCIILAKSNPNWKYFSTFHSILIAPNHLWTVAKWKVKNYIIFFYTFGDGKLHPPYFLHNVFSSSLLVKHSFTDSETEV